MVRRLVRAVRLATVFGLAVVAVGWPAVSPSGVGKAVSDASPGFVAAAGGEYEISSATLAELEDVHPGDRVKVVIQNKLPTSDLAEVSIGHVGVCPVPYPTGVPGVLQPPDEQLWDTVCAQSDTSKDKELSIRPDAVGRFEFIVTIPPEGSNHWPASVSRPVNFSCAPGDRCSIGFQYFSVNSDFTDFQSIVDVTSLSFTVKEPLQVEGCLPPAEFADVLGAFRLARTEIRWAQERCAGGKPQDLEFTAQDEISARDTFRAGQSDFFVAPGGVSEFDSGAEAGQRAAVPVPVALNAMVLAVYGRRPQPSVIPGTTSEGYIDDVRLTAEQLADILVNPDLMPATAAEMLAANPQLAALGATQIQPAITAAYATPEVGHLLTTRYLASQAGDVWRYDERPNIYPNTHGQPVGELWRLAPLNDQDFENLPRLAADRPGLGRIVDKDFREGCTGFRTDRCVHFVLTDAATAAELRLPVVKLQNKAGNFVAPTGESMSAAVQGMEPQPDGSLLADVNTTDPDAYPLTFVEYAYAPALGLVDASCQPTAKQKLINDVLGFLLGDGQRQMAEGYLPLPPPLWKTAAQQLTKVGAETTAACAAAGENGSGGDNGPGSGDLIDGVSSTGGVPGAGASPNPAGSHPTQPVTRNGQQEVLEAAQQTKIPLFAGMAGPALFIPLGALVLLTALTSGTAFATSGRRLPARWEAALGAVPRWSGRLRDRLLRRR